MANTGNKINPFVVQYFNTGPNSGSVVSSSFSIEFSGSFTSSLLCDLEYNYSIYDPVGCAISGNCIPPTIIGTYASSSGTGDDIYTIIINTNNASILSNYIEFGYVDLATTGSTSTGSILIDSTGSITNEYSKSFTLGDSNIDVVLSNCNLGSVYFRSRNICSPVSSSDWVYSEPTNCN